MAENKVNKAVSNLSDSLRETNQAIAESAVATQERNLRFAQSIFENGIKVIKSNAEDTRNLIHTVVDRPQKPQDAYQAVVNTAISAQERNVRFTQSVLQDGNEVLQHNVENARSLLQTVAEQSQRQQEAYQTLAGNVVNAYVDFIRSPFTYFQETWETAGSIVRQGVETSQRIALQGVETSQRFARSEEHTSELQSRENLVCRLLLEKKTSKDNKNTNNQT